MSLMDRKLLLISLLFLSACAVQKPLCTSTAETVRVIEHVELVPVTVFIDIPEIKEMVVVRDSSSHLENDYAFSDASVDNAGRLHHSLSTKPQRTAQTVPVPVQVRDSIVYVSEEKIVEKEVPAELTLWQTIKIKSFWWLLIPILLIIFKYIIKLSKVFA